MLRVKICGITRLEDALAAVELGADALGFIFYPRSPRNIEPVRAAEIAASLPAGMARVGVFVDTPAPEIAGIARRVGLTALQLHGDYGEADRRALHSWPRLAVMRVQPDGPLPEGTEAVTRNSEALLLDTLVPGRWGGTGRSFSWKHAAQIARQFRVVLAGGLHPENVRAAVTACRPYGVDVNSGVEAEPGRKDFDKLKRLFDQLKEYRRGWQRTESPVFPLA